jgi:hypothetical protein
MEHEEVKKIKFERTSAGPSEALTFRCENMTLMGSVVTFLTLFGGIVDFVDNCRSAVYYNVI